MFPVTGLGMDYLTKYVVFTTEKHVIFSKHMINHLDPDGYACTYTIHAI
jgi:hypothetical protein